MYIGPFKSIEAMNSTALYKPGELGSQIQLGTKAYQLIQLDSGATAATAAGLPVAGHIAFWKDKSKYLVTNDRAQALGGGSNSVSRNFVAGVFNSLTSGAAGTASITPGNYGVIQQRGAHVGVFTAGNSVTVGQSIVAESAATANGIAVAVGTAATNPVVGIASASNGAVTATFTPATLGGWDIVDVP
jgi:hypothetical protein